MSTPNPKPDTDCEVPENDRLGGVLRHTLAAGGEPTANELERILNSVQQQVSATRAETVRRVGPVLENAPLQDQLRSENQRLRAWVIRLWIGTVAALIVCGFVVFYVSLNRSNKTADVETHNQTSNSVPTTVDPGSGKSSETPKTGPGPLTLPSPKYTFTPTTQQNGETPPARTPVEPQVKLTPENVESPSPSTGPTATRPGPEVVKVPDPTPATGKLPAVAPPENVETQAAPPASAGTDDEIVVVMNGQPLIGRPIIPATENDFQLKLSDTHQIVALRWKALEITERRRVKKLYGMDESDGRLVYGEKVTGSRIHFASGKTLDALPLHDRDFNGQRAFRTSNAPLLLIAAADIQSEEPITCYESNFYSRSEIYDRWLQEKPPASDDAGAHLELARKCATIGLYVEALDALKSAEVIDPRCEEPNRDFKLSIIREHARQQSQEIFDKLLHARLTKDYFTAAECVDKLDRNFPNSELKSRWDAMRLEIEAGCKTEVRKHVIQMSYTVALDLIQKQLARRVKVDAKGNVVPTIPGKQVTTTHGHIFRGTLEPSDAYNALSLKVNDMNLTIPNREIASIDDVDLSTGVREVPLSFDDLKDYITDMRRSDGLKAQMIMRIAKTLRGAGVTEKNVRDYFDGRLNHEGHYEDGHIISEPVYAFIHDANYGTGSWLRDGAKILPLSPDNPVATLRPKNSRNVPYTAEKPTENPETSDDPNVWWTNQSADTQFSILRAMAAEKVFSAKVVEERCNDCAGTGTVIVPGPGGHPITYRCSHCRGLRVLFRLTYQ
jgi:hypothetical protein